MPDSAFTRLPGDFFTNRNTDSFYWIRLGLTATGKPSEWILEQFNYRISDLTLFEASGDGSFKETSVGDDREFNKRIFLHKNLIFPLSFKGGEKKKLHLRFFSNNETPFQLMLRSSASFTSYAVGEYFLLGFFYGIIIVFALYNFITYLSIREKVYLWYVFYVISFGIFFMVLDGTCYQYLWPNFPAMNEYGYSTFFTLAVIAFIRYSQLFLDMKENFPDMSRILNYYIGFRIIFYLAGFFLPQIRELNYLEIFPFLIIFTLAVVKVIRKDKPAVLFLASITVLFSAFVVHTQREQGIIPSTVGTFYFIYLAPLFDVVMLSFALSERIREIRTDKITTVRITQELELKVAERTEALVLQNAVIQDKVRDLDSFVYKVSHDIKGPLKSIIGLAQMAKVDKSEPIDTYLDFIIRTSNRLDSVVTDLLSIAKLKSSRLNISSINFKILCEEIIESFSGHPDFGKIRFSLHVDQSVNLYTERMLLGSVIQNVLENAINYRHSRRSSFVDIKTSVTADDLQVTISDNGIGIPKEYQEKIFEMFFRAEENASHKSTGLGLYMVKMALEKLEGTISVSSVPGEGTSFTISVRNHAASSKAPEEGVAGMGLA